MSETGKKNWHTISESQFSWEREALEFIKQRLPRHEPYRAWSNFEFIADDGSINEVDLLVFSPQGLFLIEIKSHQGRLSGDAGAWTFEHEGKRVTMDSPLLDANLKAKRLNGLLQRQKAAKTAKAKGKGPTPYIEPLVFCSDPDLVCALQDNARTRVCLRDREEAGGQRARPGIMAAITRRECPGLTGPPKGQHDKPMAKVVRDALQQAGVRQKQRQRKVSDYALDEVIDEGPGYQDWTAHHTQVKDSKRLVRLYTVHKGANKEVQQTIQRAAKREFQLLETLQHPGVLQAHGFTEHELGPALIFEYDPAARRLDHYLSERGDSLSADQRLYLIRQIAEVIRFAHEKKVIHRSLSPRSILVAGSDAGHPRIRVFNWQVGHRDSGATTASGVSMTSHVERLVDDASTAFMAPETFANVDESGEHVDVFSLGALAYYIFSGAAPAENAAALSEKLRGASGLQISAVLNGAGQELQDLIQFSTHPDVSNRLETVHDFLEHLDLVDAEVHTPDHDYLDSPLDARQGDLLAGGYRVFRRLGQGSVSVALLIEREGEPFVLKAAMNPEHNNRIETEYAALEKLHHEYIVVPAGRCDVGDHAGFLVKPVFQDREKRRIETLGERIRREGRLHIELLQRFGEDLVGAVRHLEEQGIAHRDIKPDNIAVGQVGSGNRLHAVLFDFSLTGLPADNIRAGTRGYLDPLLPLRKRWDLAAERYAAAVTLYEMATGAVPRWGDGKSDPSHTDGEAVLDSELFDPSLRDRLTAFFQRAFKRDADDRFDNAEEMLGAWRDCFKNIDVASGVSAAEDREALHARLDEATPDATIFELGLGARATNALERANLVTVQDLLDVNPRVLQRLRGVGSKTRRELKDATRRLRKRLGGVPASGDRGSTDSGAAETIDPASMSVDLLTDRVSRAGARDGESARRALHVLLGLAPGVDQRWPSQVDVAKVLELTRARVGQFVDKFRTRWAKEPAVTQLRKDISETIAKAGGVMALRELAQAVLGARGSVLEEPDRTRRAEAVIRVAAEVEHNMAEPRFLFRRSGARVIIAGNEELADYAMRLGKAADSLAAEDPLPAPTRVIERLRAVKAPDIQPPLSDARLARLAAAASQSAALSSRRELYPCGMKAERALKLSQGALLGVRALRIGEVRERVRSRYPEAEPLPDRPKLDALLKDAGLKFKWNPKTGDGEGRYELPASRSPALTESTDTTRRGTGGAGDGATPELADARQFEERLRRAAAEGAFLALIVSPKRYAKAAEDLRRRFPVEPIDAEGLLLGALREEAEKAGVNWDLVLQADAAPDQGDWDKLLLLVRRAMPHVEARLRETEKTILLLYPAVLARYNQMDLLERLRDEAGRRGGVRGLWPLIPGDSQARIGDRPLPIFGPGQCVRVPSVWPEALAESKPPEPAKS